MKVVSLYKPNQTEVQLFIASVNQEKARKSYENALENLKKSSHKKAAVKRAAASFKSLPIQR